MASALSVLCSGDQLVASGELDHTTVAVLVSALHAVGVRPLTVDLHGVDYVDSVGVATLLRARRANPDLRFVNPSTWMTRLVAFAGLTDELFDRSTSEAA